MPPRWHFQGDTHQGFLWLISWCQNEFFWFASFFWTSVNNECLVHHIELLNECPIAPCNACMQELYEFYAEQGFPFLELRSELMQLFALAKEWLIGFSEPSFGSPTGPLPPASLPRWTTTQRSRRWSRRCGTSTASRSPPPSAPPAPFPVCREPPVSRK